MTQRELMVKIGYRSQGCISEWESGIKTPPTRILPKLAEVLGCTIDDLFREE